MIREFLIRRMPQLAFAALFGAGLWLGGAAALRGLPIFLDGVLPGMAAQARPEDNNAAYHGVARFALIQGFAPSRFAPQLLYPVSTNTLPGWLSDAIQAARDDKPPVTRGARAVIAICIDDLGEDIAGTDKAMALPHDVALSFLPFADASPFLAREAARKGHLVLAHVPMQAISATNPGPMALTVGMAGDEIARRLDWDLARVPGAVGINNHEGSRFTADSAGITAVAAWLAPRHLFFFDSRTGTTSVVVPVARHLGVASAGRDIFLDDDQSAAAVAAQLDALAREAKRSGVAIAIGHPHDVTLKLLASWLAQGHGVTLVPLDAAMRMKSGDIAVAAR